MKHLAMGALVLSMLVSGAALAAPAGVADTITSATITTSSGNCLTSQNDRASLTLDATAASANLGYCEVLSGSTCTAVIGAAGTTTLASGSVHFWPAGTAPSNAFCFIAATGSQPLTIREGRR